MEQRRRLPTAVKKCDRPSVSCSLDLFIDVVAQLVSTRRLVDGFNRSATDGDKLGSSLTDKGKLERLSHDIVSNSAASFAGDGIRFAAVSECKSGNTTDGDNGDELDCGETAVTTSLPSAGEEVLDNLLCCLRWSGVGCGITSSRQTRGPRRSVGVKNRVRPSMSPRGCRLH